MSAEPLHGRGTQGPDMENYKNGTVLPGPHFHSATSKYWQTNGGQGETKGGRQKDCVCMYTK